MTTMDIELVEDRAVSLGAGVGGNDVSVIDDLPSQLLILQLDVGQGECTLIVEQHGDANRWAAVIDGGFATAGRGSLSRYVKAFGLTQIDAMFCSHFDGDHTKGLVSYFEQHAEHVPVKTLYVRNTDPDINKSSTKVKLLKAAQKAGTAIVQITAGKVVDVPNGCPVGLTCVAVDNSGTHDENACSIALVLEYGAFRYFTAGDLPSSIETTLVATIGRLDALKCGHHGSANSTPAELLSTCKPRLAFISCGEQNYGHPTYDVVERLMKANVDFYLTNCIHNRRGVNTKYTDAERVIAKQIQAGLARLRNDMKDIHAPDPKPFWPGPVYLPDNIKANVQAIEDAPGDGEKDRAALVLLKGATRAAQHETADFKDYNQGTVAGSRDYLGTLVLRVPYAQKPGVNEVGFVDQKNEWQWRKHHPMVYWPLEPEKVRDFYRKATADAVVTAIGTFLKEEGNVEISAPDRFVVQSGVKGSPGKYEEFLQHRTDSYRCFTAPTTVGLRESRKGSVFVPFCFYCRVDLVYEGSHDPLELIQVVCTGCDDPKLFVHRRCYDADDFDSSELDEDVFRVTSEGCPLCEDKGYNSEKYCGYCGHASVDPADNSVVAVQKFACEGEACEEKVWVHPRCAGACGYCKGPVAFHAKECVWTNACDQCGEDDRTFDSHTKCLTENNACPKGHE